MQLKRKSKRLRVIAGPNGSGKSTVFDRIQSRCYCGPFVNADIIERSFKEKGLLNLSDFDLLLQKKDFNSFLKNKGSSWIQKAANANTSVSLVFSTNNLLTEKQPNAYDAAIAADFVRHQLLQSQDTFTFETVLSHPSKVAFLEQARDQGYKTYLYFVCTTSADINIGRVAQRANLGGHDVPVDKIQKRYVESLQLLQHIIPLSYRCFLFDNSEQNISLIAEIEKGETLIIHQEIVPQWIEEYVITPIFR